MTHRFRIVGAVSPQLVPRILDMFAQRDLVVDRLVARRTGDRIAVSLTEATLTDHQAEIVVQRLRAMVLVEDAVRSAAPR